MVKHHDSGIRSPFDRGRAPARARPRSINQAQLARTSTWLTGLMAALAIAPARAQTPPDEAATTDLRQGDFIQRGDAATSEASTVDFKTDSPFSATYVGADVARVANEVLGDFLKLPYAIAPDVSGAVTTRIENVQSRSSAIEAVRAAFAPLGIQLVDRGDRIEIQRNTGQSGPANAAAIYPGDPAPPGGGVVVLTPRFIAPSQLAPLLTPFAQSGAVVASDDQRRIIIIKGDEATINAASSAAAMFDVDWFSQVSTGVFILKHVPPGDIIADIQRLLGPSGKSVELVAVPRLSAAMALTTSPDAMTTVRSLVERLDAPSTSQSPGMLIYQARHLAAEELAASLGESGAPVSPAQASTTSTNRSIFDRGSASSEGIGGNAETSGPFAQKASLAETAQPPSSSRQGGAQGLLVTTNASQNLLIVRGGADQLADAKRLLEAIDRPQSQVLIEAAIVEITLDDELQFGVNWEGLEERLTATFSDLPSGAVASQFPGLSLTYVNTDIQAALNLLSALTKVEVISRPSLITLNNQTANLQVGDQVPIVTQSAVSVVNPDAPIVNQTTYRDTGVILSVTPHVRAGGMVEIDVGQEVSQVARTTSSGIDSPTIQQRRIESRLLVPSGESVALGGLISQSKSTGIVGVPILRSLPLLGALFRSRSDITEKTELVVFLTPRVLSDPREAVEATDRLRSAFRRLEQDVPGQ